MPIQDATAALVGVHTLTSVAKRDAVGLATLTATHILTSTAVATAGDSFAYPLLVTPGTGTLSVPTLGATVETGEPASANGTIWVRFDTDGGLPGMLTLSTSASGVTVELYEGDSLGTLLLIGTVTSFTAYSSAVGPRTYVRVSGPGAPAVPLSYIFANRVPEMVIDVISHPTTVPGSIVVTVSSVQPNALIHFDLPDVPIPVTDFFSALADSTGTLIAVTIPIDVSLTAGGWGLHAWTIDRTGDATFFVEGVDTVIVPTGPDVIIPVPLEVGPPVQRWAVVDVAAATTWRFPTNPADISTPHAPKAYDFDVTTSPSGQVLTWEGAATPVAWKVKGYVDNAVDYQKFEDLVASNRRYLVVDHRRRGWLVAFEEWNPTPKRAVGNDWSFEYEMTLAILAGPVAVPET